MVLLRISVKHWWYVTLREWFERLLCEKYLKQFIQLDNNYTEKSWIWRTIAIVNKWIDIRKWSLNKWVSSVTDIVLMVIFTLVILWSAWIVYMLWFVVALIVVFLLATYFNWFILSWRRERKQVNVQYSNFIVRLIMSKFEILQSWKRHKEHQQILWFESSKIHICTSYAQYVILFFFWNYVLLYILVIVCMYYMWVQVMWGTATFSQFAAMSAMLVLIVEKIRTLLQFYKDVSRDRVHVEKLLNFFEQADTVHMQEHMPDLKLYLGDISISNITYGYEWNIVFCNFSLDIVWGKKTALVWVSGSWKSTLVKLISWYLKPHSWIISIDGQALDKFSLSSYYKHIWYLTQEPSVFDGSIYDNLTYAIDTTVFEKQQIDEKIKEAINLSKCEFIYDFKDWLQTEIGERWIRLSGGQRQRLAIAKIILKNPHIIILDEPTSALDSFSEEAITQAMNNLFAWRTVIIIAHRLQTVKEADEILVLSDKREKILDKRCEENLWSMIIERGTHAELVAKWWYYAKMLEVQTGF